MKIKQTLALCGTALLTVGLLASCGTKTSVPAKIDVKSGTYVLESGKTAESGEGWLALNVGIKNTSGSTMNGIYDGSFKLYDSKGNQLSTESVYGNDNSKFKTLQAGNLSPDKTLDGYIAFQVDKGEKYELHFSPMPSGADKKPDDIVVKVDTSKYKDPTKELTTLAQSYVDSVFLGKTGVKSELTNDLTKAHNDFNALFSKKFPQESEIQDYYTPSQAELGKIVTSFEAENAKRGKVEYGISEMFPDYAVVTVSPTVLKFSDVNADSIMETWENQNEGKFDDYDAAMTAASKYLVQNISQKFANTPPSQPSNMNKGGEKLILTKEKSGKWTVDDKDSDKNYDFKNIQSDFMGGMDNY